MQTFKNEPMTAETKNTNASIMRLRWAATLPDLPTTRGWGVTLRK